MKDPLKDVIQGLPRPQPDRLWQQRTHVRLMNQISAAHRSNSRSHRHRRARWLLGAVATAAIFALLLFWLPNANNSFAAVQRQIRNANRLRCVATLSVQRNDVRHVLSVVHSSADEDRGVRVNINMLGRPLAEFWLPRTGQPILVDRVDHEVVPIDLPDSLNLHQILWFDPTTLVRRLGRSVGPITPITAADGNHRADKGYQIPPQSIELPANATIKLWVNPKTQLPNELIIRVPLSGYTIVWTIDHFKWNSRVQPSHLRFTTPAGYQWSPPYKMPAPGPSPLVRTLWRYARLSAGRFPPSTMLTWQAVGHVLNMAFEPISTWKNLPAPLNTEQGERHAIGDAVAAALFYFQLHENGHQPIYRGDTVRFGEDQPLLRWTRPDGRVETIFGTLKTKIAQP